MQKSHDLQAVSSLTVNIDDLLNDYSYHNPEQLSTHCVFVVPHTMMKMELNTRLPEVTLITAILGKDSQILVAPHY